MLLLLFYFDQSYYHLLHVISLALFYCMPLLSLALSYMLFMSVKALESLCLHVIDMQTLNKTYLIHLPGLVFHCLRHLGFQNQHGINFKYLK